MNKPRPSYSLAAALAVILGAPAFAQDITGADVLSGGEVTAGSGFTSANVIITPARGPGRHPLLIFFTVSYSPRTGRSSGPFCETGSLFRNLERAGVASAEVIIGERRRGDDLTLLRRGLRIIQRRARYYRIDASRIAVFGCATAGPYAALLGADPSYLAQAGLSFDALKSVTIYESTDFGVLESPVAAGGSMSSGPQASGRRESGLAPASSLSLLDAAAPPNAPAFFFLESEPSGASARFARAIETGGGSEVVRGALPPRPPVANRPARERRLEQIGSVLAAFMISRFGKTPAR